MNKICAILIVFSLFSTLVISVYAAAYVAPNEQDLATDVVIVEWQTGADNMPPIDTGPVASSNTDTDIPVQTNETPIETPAHNTAIQPEAPAPADDNDGVEVIKVVDGNLNSEETTRSDDNQTNPIENTPTAPSVPVRDIQPEFQPLSVDMVIENGMVIMKKTYETPPDIDPQSLVQNFEDGGFSFTGREIQRRELPGELVSRQVTKTAVVEAESDDAAAVAAGLPATLSHEESGFTGRLHLDMSSITIESGDVETYTYKTTKNREIPNLPRNDVAYVDMEWEGMALADVSFKENADGTYTAAANYEGTATGERASGYVAGAVYIGEITREVPGGILYTVIYEGTIIEKAPAAIDRELPADEPLTVDDGELTVEDTPDDNEDEIEVALPSGISGTDNKNDIASALAGVVSGMNMLMIVGIAIAALLLILMLWAIIPRKNDEYVPIEEYRRRRR